MSNLAGLLTYPIAHTAFPSSIETVTLVVWQLIREIQQRVCPGFTPDSLLIRQHAEIVLAETKFSAAKLLLLVESHQIMVEK